MVCCAIIDTLEHAYRKSATLCHDMFALHNFVGRTGVTLVPYAKALDVELEESCHEDCTRSDVHLLSKLFSNQRHLAETMTTIIKT